MVGVRRRRPHTNPGTENRKFWVSGLTVARAVTRRLKLGAEVYHQTPAALGARTLTGVNLGAIYKLTTHWSLVGAAGAGAQNPQQGGRCDIYFALEATR